MISLTLMMSPLLIIPGPSDCIKWTVVIFCMIIIIVNHLFRGRLSDLNHTNVHFLAWLLDFTCFISLPTFNQPNKSSSAICSTHLYSFFSWIIISDEPNIAHLVFCCALASWFLLSPLKNTKSFPSKLKNLSLFWSLPRSFFFSLYVVLNRV